MTRIKDKDRTLETRSDQETFFSRIQLALGNERIQAPSTTRPPLSDTLIRRTPREADHPTLFAGAAVSAGAIVHHVPSTSLGSKLETLLKQLKIDAVTIGITDPSLEVSTTTAAAAVGCEIIDHRLQPGLSAHYPVAASITDVDLAIAESGTIGLSSLARSRGAFLVPPYHLAIVRTGDIVPDLTDAFRYLMNHRLLERAAAMVFITGPSKTADIEGVLITGVHGPGQLHILLLS